MKELYELKEKLCDELKSYGKKDMSAGSLDVVDKLAHTIKNLDKIIESEGYSGARGRMYDGRSYDMAYDGRSMARRDSRGRYSANGYSYSDDMIAELRELMEEAPDDKTRQEFKRFIAKIEAM